MKEKRLLTIRETMNNESLKDINYIHIISTLASELILKRMELKMTQEQFAEFMDMSQSQLSRYENCEDDLMVSELVDLFSKLKCEIIFESKKAINGTYNDNRKD